ncbi:MAG: AI-2E family transporter [Ruminococcaceae bacterium]|nr:AI-2E family transporter [Oscillospiraceae bacterium]
MDSTNKNPLWIVFYVAAGVIAAGLLGGKIGGIVVPLLVAYLLARIARPSALVISRACHVDVKVGGAVYAIVLCGAVVYLLISISGRLTDQLGALVERLPEYADDAGEMVNGLAEKIPFLKKDGGAAWADWVDVFRGTLTKITEYVGTLVASFLGDVVQRFPGVVMSVFVAAVGFVYLTADMDGAARSINLLLPEKYADKIRSAFADVSGAVFQYLRAYATLMTVTFLELSVGFSVIGVENPMAAALIIAFIDALPVFGCGSVIIPWAIWSFLSGSIVRGAGLLILLGVVYVVRQFLEPRVIGRMTGVHPFVALACVFIGLKVGGIGGMIVAPIALSCAVQVKKQKGNR